MWNEPSTERLIKIPNLYETEQTPLKQKIVHLHFFLGGCDWYVVEYDGEDIFFGYAILNNDYDMAEWGYISFRELKNINISGLEIDCVMEQYWDYPLACEIEKICKGMRWRQPLKQPRKETKNETHRRRNRRIDEASTL
jgi:hypothetical protein